MQVLKYSLFVAIRWNVLVVVCTVVWSKVLCCDSMAAISVLLRAHQLKQLRNLHTNLELLNATLFTGKKSSLKAVTLWVFKGFKCVGYDAGLECVLSPNPICRLLGWPSRTWLTKPNSKTNWINTKVQENNAILKAKNNAPSCPRLSFKTT